MSRISINGVDLELDLLDADKMEKYQEALNDVTTALQEAAQPQEQGQGLHVAESMRLQCQLTEKFIDQIFGNGTAEKCFPRKNHLGDHLEAFTLICNQANIAVQQAKSTMNKYSGQRLQNRQQRRADQKKHGNIPRNYPAQ